MKAVILAGGRGSRLSEETEARPKPLVEIGGRPIIWHIMSIYASYGITEFVVCAGYKGFLLKEYFANLALHNSDVTIDVGAGTVRHLGPPPADWHVTVADTGLETMTAGRIKRIRDYLEPGEPFCLTYGDGLADVDIAATIAFHASHDSPVTMTAVVPRARFGVLDVVDHRVTAIHEKDPAHERMVNGGFFVVDPAVIDLIDGDTTIWETGVLPPLASRGQLAAFTHRGFWEPMDTLWEKELLEGLWRSGEAPWKVW